MCQCERRLGLTHSGRISLAKLTGASEVAVRTIPVYTAVVVPKLNGHAAISFLAKLFARLDRVARLEQHITIDDARVGIGSPFRWRRFTGLR